MKGGKSKAQIAPSDQTEVQHFREEVIAENIMKNREKEENFQRLLSSEQSGEKRIEMEQNQKQPSLSQDLDFLNQKIGQNSQKGSYFNKRLHYINMFRRKIKFTQTKKRFLQIIDDYAFDYDVFFYKHVFQHEFVSKVANLDQKSGAIMLPSSFVSRIWDLIQFIFLTVYIIYLPIRLAFDSLYDDQYYFIFFEVLPNITQIINMFLEFNTGFYRHGQIILDRWQICFNYFSKKFIYDFVLNICWLISLSPDVSIWVKFIGLLRIIVLFKIIAEIEQTNSLRETYGNFFSLLKLGSFIFLCAHLACCCWYSLAIHEENLGSPMSWLIKDIDSYQSNSDVNLKMQGYIAGMYYCIVSMTTIGYGDISPTTYRERVFAIIFCILSSFLFAFTMNSIGEIIKQFSLKGEEFKQQMAMLNVYMKKRNLSTELQVRVRKYYENQNVELQENNEQGSQMIDNLTPELREDVQKDIYTNLFRNIKFFQSNFSERLLSNLYRIVIEKQYAIDEKIFEEGDSSDKLYVILKGEVQLILQNRHNLITLNEGEVLGQTEFFTQQSFQFSAKAKRNTQFAVINYSDFIKLVNENKHDHESHCQIRDILQLNSNLKNIEGVKCESCGETDHIFSKCQMISLTHTQKNKVVESNKRKQITRLAWARKTISYQALLSRFQIELRAKEVIEDQEIEKKQEAFPRSPTIMQNHSNSKKATNYGESDEERKGTKVQPELNDSRKGSIFFDVEESKKGAKALFNAYESKKGTKIFDHMDQSLKLIDNIETGSDQQDELNDNVFNEFQDNSLQGRNRNSTNYQQREVNPALVNLQAMNRTQEEDSIEKSNNLETLPKDNRQEYHHHSFPMEDGLNPKRRQQLPKLSIRASKLPSEITDIKNNLDKKYIPLVDLKKEVNEEVSRRASMMKTRTIVNIEVDQEDQKLEEDVQMQIFQYYLIHNNYDIVLHQFNELLQKNQRYTDLILKSKRKKTIKMRSQYQDKVKNLTHKKVPSSQKFYLMKQRHNKLTQKSQEQTPLLKPIQPDINQNQQ